MLRLDEVFPRNGVLRLLARIANKALAPIGLQITRVHPKYGSLDIYTERARPDPPRYVNIGAGSFYHPYWHNLDMPNDFYASSQRRHIHVEHDLTSQEPLPFCNDTLAAVYTSHVIEHISDRDVEFLFAEVTRCLQPGGFFRITCPDIDLEYDAYCRRDSDFWMWPTPWGKYSISIEQKFLEHFATALTLNHPSSDCRKYSDEEIRAVFTELPKEDALDFFTRQIPLQGRLAYPENHVNWFNTDKIQTMLKSTGFQNTYASGYGQSKCPLMRNTRLFDSTCPGLSLYVECQK